MQERKAWLMAEIYNRVTEDWGIVLFCLASHTGLEEIQQRYGMQTKVLLLFNIFE